MHVFAKNRTLPSALMVAVCVVVATGCASWQGPRIDPTGESLLIWPNEPVPAPVVGPAAPAPAIGPASPAPTIGPPVAAPPYTPSNIVAPPVYSDTTLGAPAAPTIAPAPAPAAPVPATMPPPPGAAIVGQEHLQLSPQNVMAPVGSEVVLKAGICTAHNHLLANHRIEWMLARDGAGQFVDLNGRGELDAFSWPWDTPRKIDNWYAIGSTSKFPIVLDRGTPNPADDIQVRRGEAWISVTSLTEGTSYVTAYTPSVADWHYRRAVATIHWIDAQWVFAPSAVAEAGRPHVLTTCVSRRSDGAPLAGWIVRYEVAGGGSLGYAGGNVVEVPTDSTGRASVELTPTEAGGGTATANMVLMRPAGATPSAGAPLEVARGVATITWATATEVSPPPTPEFSTPPPPGQFEPPSPRDTAPSDMDTPPPPRDTTPSDIYSPPPDEPPPGRPRLELNMRRFGSEQVRVGDFARFEVTVTNVGDDTARGIHLTDRFDRELSHPSAEPGSFAVEYGRMRDLPPGESETVPLNFEVKSAGRPCHEVTVTADGAAAATTSACITAVAPPPAAKPMIEVTKQGPARHYIGEFAKFKTVIKNSGTVPITNLRIVDEYDPAFEIRMPDAGAQQLGEGRIEWRVDRLGPGELREFNVQCKCVSQSASACSRVVVTGDDVDTSAEKCIEILPLVQPPPPATNVTLSIVETSVTTRVGERMTFFVRAENAGVEPAQEVAVRVLVPGEMSPDLGQIQPPGQFTTEGEREIRFAAIESLDPGQRAEFTIPVQVDRTGTVNMRVQLRVGDGEPKDFQSKAVQILPATQ